MWFEPRHPVADQAREGRLFKCRSARRVRRLKCLEVRFRRDDGCNPAVLPLGTDRQPERACCGKSGKKGRGLCRSEEHTSELQSHLNLVCRLLLEKKKKKKNN